MTAEYDRATVPTLLERITPAMRVAMHFWAALADDDDEALAPMLSPTWDDRPDGFPALYRADRQLAPETCRVMGFASFAQLLAADRIRLFFSITDRVIHSTAGEPQLVWRLELVEIDGRWLVDRSSDLQPIQGIDLTPLFGFTAEPDDAPTDRLN